MTKKASLTTALVVISLVAALAGAYAAQRILNRPAPAAIEGLLWPSPKTLQAFELVDQFETKFGPERFDGRWTLIFFGYTHCPDVCPLTLAALEQAKSKLVSEHGFGDELQIVFVSVDPARDTPKFLGQYVGHFDQDFLGVTGTESALKRLTGQLGILSVARHQGDDTKNYLVDHTTAVLVIGPQRQLLGLLRAPHQGDALAKQVSSIRGFVEG